MDEAMNPLTLLTFGLYGDVLPNQDGAPVRIVVPWKYGFKSAKSIVDRPLPRQAAADHLERAWDPANTASTPTSIPTSITRAGARRPSAASACRFYAQRRTTLMFNGYGDQVASLYNGMDLKKNF